MNNERLKKQLDFLLECDKEKNIFRQTYLSNASRKENDAEHSWHLALMVFVLSEYSNEKIDVSRAALMALAHDLVEIYAGDTYAYDKEAGKDKEKREREASKKLFSMLPSDQEKLFSELFDEFERMETPEALFVNAIDKIQPVMLTDASGGKSWKEHNISKHQILERNLRTGDGSRVLWEAAKELIDKNSDNGVLRKP